MSAKGVGDMTFIDGAMNACGCTKVLADKMTSLQKLGIRGIFQHDNDPKHTAKITQEFLMKKKVQTMTWPSMFSDLKPIEQLWGILKKKGKQHNPFSKEQLKKNL